MASHNFLVSQPPAVILSENLIQTLANSTISNVFQFTRLPDAKIKVKLRKRPDCTTTSREANALADDITLRV